MSEPIPEDVMQRAVLTYLCADIFGETALNISRVVLGSDEPAADRRLRKSLRRLQTKGFVRTIAEARDLSTGRMSKIWHASEIGRNHMEASHED